MTIVYQDNFFQFAAYSDQINIHLNLCKPVTISILPLIDSKRSCSESVSTTQPRMAPQHSLGFAIVLSQSSFGYQPKVNEYHISQPWIPFHLSSDKLQDSYS